MVLPIGFKENCMKTLIISGGSSGIGEACVRKYIANNYMVFNLDIRNNSDLSKIKNYTWVNTDITLETQISAALNKIQLKQLDVLIISAGKHLSANIENTSSTELLDLINLNLLGAFWLIKHSIPIMKQQNYGNIITIGSDQSFIAKPNSTVYGMTKAALAQLTKSTALDYAKFNIRANCIAAGTIDTPLYRMAIEKYAKKSGIPLAQIEQNEATRQPIGRVGTPNEIAELAYFLGQDNSAYITGSVIPIDGGYTTQ